MKIRALSVLVMVLLAGAAFAACTADQWKIDLELAQTYLSSDPKNYLGAINLHRTWIEYAKTQPEEVKAITGLPSPAEDLTASLNNVYRDAAQAIVTSYSDLIAKDPVKAAELGIAVRKYFRDNPAIASEFATAIGASRATMFITLDKAIREGFMKVYAQMASDYSRLVKEGKTAEAAQLSASWDKIMADLQANGNPLPEEFRKFTGIDLDATIDMVRAFEKDVEAYKAAIYAGDFDKAFAISAKWEEFCTKNPQQAQALNYFFNAANGATPRTKIDWKAAFQGLRLEIYEAMFRADCQAYSAMIAKGDLAGAKALVAKWQKIIAGPEGALIAGKLGTDLAGAEAFLNEVQTKLENIDPAFTSETVESFKKDLATYQAHVETFQNSVPGSGDWYGAVAQAMTLADKWSRIAIQNPSLAEEIRKATGVNLPQDSDNVIKAGLDAAMQDTAVKFTKALGTGDFTQARDLLTAWRKYLDENPRVKELAAEKWGPDFLGTLERYEKGLTTMIGGEATTAPVSSTSDVASSTGSTGDDAGTDPAAIETSPAGGLGGAGQ
ncbi:MAG: hypothetical protein GX442_03835 [Candidatus Riflebacteria bacterium]|nr:hypothetical protein [Candidatus Riflebacteria bacterium]